MRALVLSGILWLAAPGPAGSLRAQEEGIHWFDNYAEALRQARETGKPIFLEYRCEP
jgi:hypothetical protein